MNLYVWRDLPNRDWGMDAAAALAPSKEKAIEDILTDFVRQHSAEFYNTVDTEIHMLELKHLLEDNEPEMPNIGASIGYYFAGAC